MKIILFFLCSYASVWAQSSSETKLFPIATNFLAYLKNQDFRSLQKIISTNISLKLLNKDEIMQLTDDLIMDRINTYRYVLYITGNNIRRFIRECRLLSYTSACSFECEEIASDRALNGKLYFIKFSICYEEMKKIIKEQVAEIDIIWEKDKYKIFGFVY